MSYEVNKPIDQAVRALSSLVFKRGRIIAWITLILTLIATIISWYYIRNKIEQDARLKFEYRSNQIKNAIIERMQAYEQILRGGLGFFYATENVTRDAWKDFISTLRINEKYPGILGIGFAKYFPGDKKSDLERQIRSEGFPFFRIWPDYERDIYTAVIYLEPFNEANKRALGYDMFSEVNRRTALENARDYGRTTLTGKVILVQENEKDIQPGCLILLPFYDKDGDTTTIDGRRNSILGFVCIPFRINELIKGIFGKQLTDIKLRIYDDKGVVDEKLMFNSTDNDSILNSIEKHYYEQLTEIDINGKAWTLRFSSLPQFETGIDREKPLIVLISGILISSLFFIVARNLSNIFIINRKLEQLLGSTIEGVYGIDREGRCTFINNSASKMLGYTPEEILKKDFHSLVHYKKENGESYPVSECPNIISMETQEGNYVESDVFWRKDGTYFPVEYSSYPIIDDGQTSGAVIAFTDISERKRNLAQIEASLKEKEVLLREVHHRVKNNLQIISSMLNIQSSYITDEKSHIIFEESRNRVKSMALIHEKLYQNESLSRLNLKEYVSELVDNLMKSYKKSINQIDTEIRIMEVFLNADTAIPLGLIINELVSNSLKYAFPDNKRGKITLSITPVSDSRFKMIVTDDGIGLPPDFDFSKTDTLGLQLVSSLVSQLDGDITLQNGKGTWFEINFKAVPMHS